MCVSVSSLDSIGGSDTGEWASRPLKILECWYQGCLDTYLDSRALDSYIDEFCIYSLCLCVFNFLRSIKSKTSFYNFCNRYNDSEWELYNLDTCSVFRRISTFVFTTTMFFRSILKSKQKKGCSNFLFGIMT